MRFTTSSDRRADVNAASHAAPSTAKRPLPPSLKKSPSALAAKWNSYIEAIGIHHEQHVRKRGGAKKSSTHKGERHVHFPACEHEFGQEFERPETTEEEKACYHYSAKELGQMMNLGKHLAHQESRFAGLPDNTIFEQGYLTLPASNVFFHHKRYYCLLKGHQLLAYSSSVHAAKNTGLKCHFTIIQVQDCQAMNMQKKIAMFGANLPQQIGLMLAVTTSQGERVMLTTDNRLSKRNWLHTLRKLTEVVECVGSPTESEEDDDESGRSPVDKKQRGANPPELCYEEKTTTTMANDIQSNTEATAQPTC
ncbi:Multiple inositol polyphosphate phosphatase 1, partial [Globisporangium splendens]